MGAAAVTGRVRCAAPSADHQKEKKSLLASQHDYANALACIDMYHSSACWKTATSAGKHFKKLTSDTAKREAVKEQIRIRVLGFGWEDLHHPWSRDGVAYTPEQLLDHLIKTIIPEQKRRTIPKSYPQGKIDTSWVQGLLILVTWIKA